MPSSRGRLSVLYAGAGLVTAAVVYWTLFGLPFRNRAANSASPPDFHPVPISAKEHAALVQERWSRLPMTRLTPAEQRAGSDAAGSGASSMESTNGNSLLAGTAIESAIRNAPGLSATMKESLQTKIEGELRARSGTVEDYMSFADGDATTRWIAPEDARQWANIDMRWELYGHAPNHADVVGLLRECVDDLYRQRKGRWIGFSPAPDGVRLVACKVRTRDEVDVRLEEALGAEGTAQRDIWLRANDGAPIQFRMPKRSLDGVLGRAGSAQVVVLMVIVEIEKGDRFNWNSLWVWNPDAKVWSIDSMSRKGWGTSVVWE